MIDTLKNQNFFGLITKNSITIFSFARLILMTLVLLTTTFLKQEVLGVSTVIQIYSILSASFLIALMQVSFWDQTLKARLFIPSQLLYDLLLTSYLVYVTGVNDSIFLFIYLLNIVFGSVIYQLWGALTIALTSGLVYALIYAANLDMSNTTHWYNLAHSELLFFLTALLSGQLMDELKKQKLTLEKQTQSIERLELLNDRLLNNIPSGILLVDSEDYILNINNTALNFLNLQSIPKFKIKFFELIPELKDIFDKWQKLPEHKKIRYLFRDARSLDQVFHLQLLDLAKKNQTGKSGERIIVFQEVSKILSLEKKLESESRLAAVGQLAAGIAHEIRNPLASISGSIELLSLSKEQKTDQEKNLISISLREIKRLNNLITDFLEYAKPKDQSPDDMNLFEVINECIEEFQNANEERSNVVFANQVKSEILVSFNKERFKQILLNLFINSFDAKKDTQLRILITGSDINNSEYFSIFIRDNGIGIPKDLEKKIFDPFFTTKNNGTGLGLSTVLSILKAANASISLVPSDSGACFKIEIPLSKNYSTSSLGKVSEG